MSAIIVLCGNYNEKIPQHFYAYIRTNIEVERLYSCRVLRLEEL